MYEKILIIILIFIVLLKIIRTIFVTKSIKSSYKEIINTNKQIKTHQFQDIIVDIKKQRGDEGEKQLKQFILTNKNFGKATIFASKRLFDKSNNHKREIDIIIVTKKNIYIIECKNWAGQILSFNENSSKISYRSN
ncbi:MAG: NERD domain-containing protein, partial [Deltaproteobacteria bacterium]|nr:NERD domain-containing protein [Deltaproteobacteria bacterium]